MSNCNCYFFCYVLLFLNIGTHVYSWTERPSTRKCDLALTIELELTLEPEQPLKNVKVKSEREPIPVENLSCRTAMLSFFDEFTPVWLWCCLYVSYVIRSQAYAWTEGPSPPGSDLHAVTKMWANLTVDEIWTKNIPTSHPCLLRFSLH